MSCQCQPVGSVIGLRARMCLAPMRPLVTAASPRSRYSESSRSPSRFQVASVALIRANAVNDCASSRGPSYRGVPSLCIGLVSVSPYSHAPPPCLIIMSSLRSSCSCKRRCCDVLLQAYLPLHGARGKSGDEPFLNQQEHQNYGQRGDQRERH